MRLCTALATAALALMPLAVSAQQAPAAEAAVLISNPRKAAVGVGSRTRTGRLGRRRLRETPDFRKVTIPRQSRGLSVAGPSKGPIRDG